MSLAARQRTPAHAATVREPAILIAAACAAAVIVGALSVTRGPLVLALGSAIFLALLVAVPGARVRLGLIAMALLFLAPTTITTFPAITLAYLGTALLALLCMNLGGQATARFAPIAISVLLVPIVSIISSGGSVRDLFQAEKPLLAAMGACWLAIVLAVHRPSEFRAMLRWIVWLSIPIACLAVYQRQTGTWPVLDDYARLTSAFFPDRSVGVFGHPIVYGLFTLFALTLAWFIRPTGWAVAIGFNLAGMVLSGSRGAWLSLLIVIAAYGAIRLVTRNEHRSRDRAVPIAVLIGMLIVAIAFAMPAGFNTIGKPVQDRLEGADASTSNQARVRRAQLGVGEIVASPKSVLFGHGPDSSAKFWKIEGSLRDGGAATFDNTYLTIAYEFGLLGLLVISFALFSQIVRPGNIAGSLVLLGLAANLYTFDAQGWPVVTAILAIGVAIKSPNDPLNAS